MSQNCKIIPPVIMSHNCKINTVSQYILFQLLTILSPLLYSPVMSSHFLIVNVFK